MCVVLLSTFTLSSDASFALRTLDLTVINNLVVDMENKIKIKICCLLILATTLSGEFDSKLTEVKVLIFFSSSF